MPSFIDALISPFVDLFSFVGIPVQKLRHTEWYASTTLESIPFEQEINADVREVENFEREFPAKIVEIMNPNNKFNFETPMDQFDCGKEIPILLINNNELTYIMASKSADRDKDGIDWQLYKKVSQIKTVNRYGNNISLEQLLNDVSRPKESNAPKRYRPIASIVQGGSINIEQAIRNNSTNEQKAAQFQRNCNECDEERIKTRPNFPVYAPIIQRT